MTVHPPTPPPHHRPTPQPAAPIDESLVDDEGEESASLRDPSRRLAVRTLLIITAVLWLAALITLAIVAWLWHTAPLRPVSLG